ncbi:MAG TPA: TetR/AcrR family transcriptional regulator [Thermomicrobiales bacterium]|nr:TetR/AcrR family transcriptional regulator [Thermomicrobiales bacterium]
MSPRPYNAERRQVAAEETRQRILDAACALLASAEPPRSFSVEAIARQADVARMTVYYQFGSKPGLLEALFDHLATRAEIGARLRAAFSQPDPVASLHAVIAAFAHFWTLDRLIIRRLHALAVLDPELEPRERARNERRRTALRRVLEQLRDGEHLEQQTDPDGILDTLQGLTSFETFDHLAGPDRTPEDVIPIVCRIADSLLGVGDAVRDSIVLPS